MHNVLIALSIAVAGLGVACNKGGGGIGGAGAGGATASAMDKLPKETSVLVGFSWAKFKDSKLFTMLQSAVPEQSKAELQKLKDDCQVDFMNDLDSLLVASGGNMEKDRTLIFVKGKWDEDKINKCATAMGQKENKKITSAKDGAITTYQVEGEQPVHVAWQGDTIVLTPAAMEGDKTYLADMLKQKSSIKENAPFMEILGKVDTGSTLWAAVLVPPDNAELAGMTNKMTGGTEKLQAGWLSLKLGKDLDCNGGMRFGNEAEAKTVAEKLTKELEGAKADPTAGEYLKSLTVAQAGNEVTFKLALSEAQVDKLLEMAKQMLPMLGMMMGGGL